MKIESAWPGRKADPSLQAIHRPATLQELTVEAMCLEARALALRRYVRTTLSRELEDAGSRWSIYEISAARRGDSAGIATQIVREMQDPSMRSALRDLDGHQTGAEAILCFERCGVIRHFNLLTTAPEAERRATLHRLFDWWIIAGRPACERLRDGDHVETED